jgi:hypothetical protein
MEVSRKKIEPTDENFQQYLLAENKTSKWDYYIESLSTDRYRRSQGDDPVAFANGILDEYNFIGITERMDESAVVLMMLLDLNMSDILFLSAKGKGGYDDAGHAGKCTFIWKGFVTPAMQEFFESNEWQARVKADMALYQAANRSLDLTIDRLGRAKFQEYLAKYLHAKQVLVHRCLSTVVFPCDEGGNRHERNETDCLWKDSGCGTSCLDQVSTELDLW